MPLQYIVGSHGAAATRAEFYTYPCFSKLDISLSFSGHAFSLNLFDFNLGRTSSDSPYVHSDFVVLVTLILRTRDCVGGILSLGDGFPSDLAIIGIDILSFRIRLFH